MPTIDPSIVPNGTQTRSDVGHAARTRKLLKLSSSSELARGRGVTLIARKSLCGQTAFCRAAFCSFRC